MWNKKHNSDTKISGHTFTKNWKIAQLPIKVHPSEKYCNSGGIDCQYLRWKDAGKTQPFCAWNLEYRGVDKMHENDTPTKGPLKFDDKGSQVLKAAFCRRLRINYYSNEMDTWENTEIDKPTVPEEPEEE